MTKIGWCVVIMGYLLVVILLVLAMCSARAELSVIGYMRVGSIRAEIMAEDAQDCDCCPALWNGGIVTTTADLSGVKKYDMADIITLDGGHYVMECIAISHAVKGFIKADGDVVICVKTGIPFLMRVYRFTRL